MHTYIADWTTIILQESVCGLNMIRNAADCPELTQAFVFALLFTSNSVTLVYIMNHSMEFNTTDQNRTLCKQKVRLTQQYSNFICAGAVPLTLTAKFTTVLMGDSCTFWQAMVCYYYRVYHLLWCKAEIFWFSNSSQGTQICFKYDAL